MRCRFSLHVHKQAPNRRAVRHPISAVADRRRIVGILCTSRAALTRTPVSSRFKIGDRLGRGCMTAGGHGSCRDPAANRNELYVLPLAPTVRRNSEPVSAGKIASEPSQPIRRPSSATRLPPPWRDRFRVWLIEIPRARAPSRTGARSERTPVCRECRFFLQSSGADAIPVISQVTPTYRKIRLISRTRAVRECRFFLQLILRCLRQFLYLIDYKRITSSGTPLAGIIAGFGFCQELRR
jgi:hypothetical protein